MSAAPEPTTGSLPARARAMMRPTSWVSPGPHTRCGRTTTVAGQSGARRRRAPPTPRRPCSGRSARGRRGDPRAGAARRPARARVRDGGRETCTSRATPARRQAATTLRVPVMLARANSRYRPGMSTLAARCTTASWPATAARTAAAVGDVGEHLAVPQAGGRRCSTVTSSPRAASASATAPPSIPLRPGDQDLHGRCPARPPASTPLGPAADPAAVDLGGVPDVDRQPRGAQHGGDVDARRRAHGASERLGSAAAARAGRGGRVAHDDDHHLLRAARAHADDGGGVTPSTASTRCSTPTGVTGPAAVVITCAVRPSTHSRPSSSRCPTSPVRCHPASRDVARSVRPELVVAVLDVGRADADLAGDARSRRSAGRRPPRRPTAG